ncbi:hypothetical protein KLP28_08575 [Nocardioidaceae bacterium]|nr:hypothetical protein KLP28_08575 [Nocardioidaceae bacterium]
MNPDELLPPVLDVLLERAWDVLPTDTTALMARRGADTLLLAFADCAGDLDEACSVLEQTRAEVAHGREARLAVVVPAELAGAATARLGCRRGPGGVDVWSVSATGTVVAESPWFPSLAPTGAAAN